ncbi:MAG: PDZ domain-containing protein [Alphaproteobacteria bacterium]|nr:PDZ domain-containing protein [Alphaproteobacteria bacterium]
MRAVALRVLLGAALVSGGVATTGAADDAVRARADVAFWESVRNSKDPSELEAYLKSFPQGQFAPLATIRLKKLREAAGDRKADPQPAARAPTWLEMQSNAPGAPPSARSPGQTEARAGIPKAPQAQVRGWIGAEIRGIDENRARELSLAGPGGVEVISLVSFGPAASSGLKVGDVILSADSEPLVDHAHLVRLISAMHPKQSVSLAMQRDGRQQTVSMTVGNYFEDQWAAAHRNDALGMINLGSLYADGSLVGKNLPEARKWFERAANAGSAVAMRTIAGRYETGQGFEQNDREAFEWYSRAATAGDAHSMFALGLFYVRGRGAERDTRKAAQLFEQAAALGHPGATQNFALALDEGNGAIKNPGLAVEYFRRAAKLGQPEAFAALARAYHEGRGTHQDFREALLWYREAAKRGHSNGYMGIGTMHERGEGGLSKDRAEAIKNYRKAAELNNPDALAKLKALKATPHDPAEVHKLLAALGFDPGPRPGPKTADAIRKFQQSQGVPADGTATLRLVGQLRAALTKKETEGKLAAAKAAAQKARAERAPQPDHGGLQNLEKLD